MIPELEKAFQKLELQKHAVFSDVEGWPAAQARLRPQPDEWSALQVLDHLVRVEKAMVDAVRLQLPGGTLVPLRDSVAAFFVIAVMRSPMRVKVPKTSAMVLPEAPDLSETGKRWHEVRRDMATLLGSLGEKQLGRGLFRHPVSGWMTISQGLAFLSAHIRHHRYQLKRLRVAAATQR